LEQESANIRAAFDWFVGQASDQDVAMALRLGGELVRFWSIHGYWSQGRNLLEKALAIRASVAPSIRAKAIAGAAMLVWFQGDYDRAEELLKEGLRLYRQIGDQEGMALGLWMQGRGALVRHHYADAHKLLEEALMLSRKVGDKWSGYILVSLAHPALSQGDASRTTRLLKESIALFREIGNKSDEAWALIYLARDLMKHQEYARARLLLEESLGICRETSTKWGMAYALRLLGELAIQQDDLSAANSLLTESIQLNREMGDQRNVAHSLLLLASVITSQGDYVRARALYEESLGIAKALSRLDLLAASLAGLGRVVAAQGEPVWAARLWGAVEVLREGLPSPLPPVDRADYERAVANVRAQLGEQAFSAAWQEGRTMKLEQVIDDVLKRRDEVGKQ
jgi:tetratricopeptide (TPR) repeat protein